MDGHCVHKKSPAYGGLLVYLLLLVYQRCQGFLAYKPSDKGLPSSQWCPNGSTIRPMRQPYSLHMGQTMVAPAATARSKAASRVFDGEDDADGASAEGLGAEVQMFGGLVG